MKKEHISKIVSFFIEERYKEKIEQHPTRYNITPFQILLWAFLSHRSRDENTEKVFFNLIKVAKTPQDILKLDTKRLQKLIYSIGFYRNKSKRLKQLCKVLVEKYNGKVPKTREELLSLPGVGFKTSAIVLSEAYNLPIIPVDVHVFRVSKRLGLAELDMDAEEVRLALEKQIPKNKWDLINIGMIKFGREICKPVNPLCIKDKNNCPFSGFCRAYKTKKFYMKPFEVVK